MTNRGNQRNVKWVKSSDRTCVCLDWIAKNEERPIHYHTRLSHVSTETCVSCFNFCKCLFYSFGLTLFLGHLVCLFQHLLPGIFVHLLALWIFTIISWKSENIHQMLFSKGKQWPKKWNIKMWIAKRLLLVSSFELKLKKSPHYFPGLLEIWDMCTLCKGSWQTIVPYHTIPYHIVPYNILLFCSIPYSIML